MCAGRGGFGQGDVAAGHHVSGAAGMADSPSTREVSPSWHHAVLGQFGDLGVVQDGLVEHQAVFEGRRSFGLVDRRAMSAEAPCPASTNWPISANPCLRVLAHASDHEHIAVSARRPDRNELDRPLGAMADRVGEAGDGCEPRPSGPPCRRSIVSSLLETGLGRWTCMSTSRGTIRPWASKGGFLAGRGGVVGGDATVGQQQVVTHPSLATDRSRAARFLIRVGHGRDWGLGLASDGSYRLDVPHCRDSKLGANADVPSSRKRMEATATVDEPNQFGTDGCSQL